MHHTFYGSSADYFSSIRIDGDLVLEAFAKWYSQLGDSPAKKVWRQSEPYPCEACCRPKPAAIKSDDLLAVAAVGRVGDRPSSGHVHLGEEPGVMRHEPGEGQARRQEEPGEAGHAGRQLATG